MLIAGPTPTFQLSFEGVSTSIMAVSASLANDADKPVYLTVQDMLGAGI